MGRPPIPKAQRKCVRLSFRLTPASHKAIVQAAKQRGKSVGEFISDALKTVMEGGA